VLIFLVLVECDIHTQKDFYEVLHHMLKWRLEVSELQCVNNAKIPLLRFIFDEILIDPLYVRFNL